MIAAQYITLSELQRRVRQVLEERFALPLWVSAEIAEVKVNYSGHCYLELVEKGEGDGVPKAQARAVIDEMKHDIEDTPMDEDELARLAEEQSAQTTEQPAEDNTAFRMLPVIAGVIAVALVLLYFVTNRM